MKTLIKRLLKDESGQGLAEYGLILGLVAVAVIVVLGLLGEELDRIFGFIKGELEGVQTD